MYGVNKLSHEVRLISPEDEDDGQVFNEICFHFIDEEIMILSEKKALEISASDAVSFMLSSAERDSKSIDNLQTRGAEHHDFSPVQEDKNRAEDTATHFEVMFAGADSAQKNDFTIEDIGAGSAKYAPIDFISTVDFLTNGSPDEKVCFFRDLLSAQYPEMVATGHYNIEFTSVDAGVIHGKFLPKEVIIRVERKAENEVSAVFKNGVFIEKGDTFSDPHRARP